jgi:hypothetical protein
MPSIIIKRFFAGIRLFQSQVPLSSPHLDSQWNVAWLLLPEIFWRQSRQETSPSTAAAAIHESFIPLELYMINSSQPWRLLYRSLPNTRSHPIKALEWLDPQCSSWMPPAIAPQLHLPIIPPRRPSSLDQYNIICINKKIVTNSMQLVDTVCCFLSLIHFSV